MWFKFRKRLSISKAPLKNTEPFGKYSQWAFGRKSVLRMLKVQSWCGPVLNLEHLANAKTNFFAFKLPSLSMAYSDFASLITIHLLCEGGRHQIGPARSHEHPGWQCLGSRPTPSGLRNPRRESPNGRSSSSGVAQPRAMVADARFSLLVTVGLRKLQQRVGQVFF